MGAGGGRAAETAAKEAAAAAGAAEAARAAAPAEEEGLPLEGLAARRAGGARVAARGRGGGGRCAKAVVFTKFGDALGVVGPLLEGRGIGCVTPRAVVAERWHGLRRRGLLGGGGVPRDAARGEHGRRLAHVRPPRRLRRRALRAARGAGEGARLADRPALRRRRGTSSRTRSTPLRADKQAEVGGVDVRIGALVQGPRRRRAARARGAGARWHRCG